MGKRTLWALALLVCAGCTAPMLRRARVEPSTEVSIVSNAAEDLGCGITDSTSFADCKPQVRGNDHRDKTASSAADNLQAASRCLDQRDDDGAARRLAAYVEENPDHAVIRAHLGELLMRLNRHAEAKRQFTTYVAQAQQQGEPIDRHMLDAHTRLLDIARDAGDVYAENLHRGIGLYLLACQVRKLTFGDDDGPDPQQLLCRASKALQRAAKEQPESARPYWYLHLVWAELGQVQPARRALHQARDRVAVGDLTPMEHQRVALAK